MTVSAQPRDPRAQGSGAAVLTKLAQLRGSAARGSGLRAQGSGLRTQVLGLRAQGSRLKSQGSGLRGSCSDNISSGEASTDSMTGSLA